MALTRAVPQSSAEKSAPQRSFTTFRSFPNRRCLLPPPLQHTPTPVHKVVHVLKELLPGEPARCWVWGFEAWARAAIRVLSKLFAHVLTKVMELVLDLRAVHRVLGSARLLALRTP